MGTLKDTRLRCDTECIETIEGFVYLGTNIPCRPLVSPSCDTNTLYLR